MADKPVTTDVTAGSQYKASVLNANFAALEDAIENCLGRGGTSESPNSMTGDLDMDLNDIINVGYITTQQLSIGGQVIIPTESATTTIAETHTLSDGQTQVVFTAETVTGIFYINGPDADNGRLIPIVDFTANHETKTVTLNQSYPAGTILLMAYFEGDSVDPSMTTTGIIAYTTLSDLRGAYTYTDAVAYLKEEGRAGTFKWDSSDLSTEVTADTQSGIYVAPSSDLTGASGAWVRQYSGAVNVKWFGASAGVASDQSTAIQAAVDFCVDNNKGLVIQSSEDGDKDYQIDSGVVFEGSGLNVEFIGGAYLKPVDENLLVPLTIGGTSQPARMRISNAKVDRGSYNGTTENIGVLYLEFNQSTIENVESRWSKYNQVFEPTIGGIAYNVFINPQSIGGYHNFWMKEMGAGGNTGYVNENDFVGGRGFTTVNTNTNFKVDGGTNPYGTGHNRISMSLEGSGVQAIYDNGASNQWVQCRTEGTWSSGAGHVYGPDCKWPLVISSRYDYTIDKSGATDPRDQVISYNDGSKFSTALNGLTTLELENQSASGGSGLDIKSNLDVDTAFAWRVMRFSDSLVRASLTTNGELTVARQLKNEQSGYAFEPFVLGSDWFWIDGNYFRHHGVAPSSATDGRIIMENQTSVAAGLGNIANIVNTTDKYTGKMVYDTGLKRPVWANGSAAADIWVFADGTTAYTPA